MSVEGNGKREIEAGPTRRSGREIHRVRGQGRRMASSGVVLRVSEHGPYRTDGGIVQVRKFAPDRWTVTILAPTETEGTGFVGRRLRRGPGCDALRAAAAGTSGREEEEEVERGTEKANADRIMANSVLAQDTAAMLRQRPSPRSRQVALALQYLAHQAEMNSRLAAE